MNGAFSGFAIGQAVAISNPMRALSGGVVTTGTAEHDSGGNRRTARKTGRCGDGFRHTAASGGQPG